jgi:uncharacterized phage-associated protein
MPAFRRIEPNAEDNAKSSALKELRGEFFRVRRILSVSAVYPRCVLSSVSSWLSIGSRRAGGSLKTSTFDVSSAREAVGIGNTPNTGTEASMLDNPQAITAQDVADYFLASVDASSGDNISNLKLQKLVYYAQGFYLAMNDGRPLFGDPIVAWEHGPVVPTLYRCYKEYGAGAIPPPDSFDALKFDQETIELLDEVNRVYGQFSPLKLRAMTHEEPPWRLAPLNSEISQKSMQDYFRTLLVDA